MEYRPLLEDLRYVCVYVCMYSLYVCTKGWRIGPVLYGSGSQNILYYYTPAGERGWGEGSLGGPASPAATATRPRISSQDNGWMDGYPRQDNFLKSDIIKELE